MRLATKTPYELDGIIYKRNKYLSAEMEETHTICLGGYENDLEQSRKLCHFRRGLFIWSQNLPEACKFHLSLF